MTDKSDDELIGRAIFKNGRSFEVGPTRQHERSGWRCVGTVRRYFGGWPNHRQCDRPGVVAREIKAGDMVGTWHFCRQHDPIARRARQEERDKAWRAEREAARSQSNREAATRAARDRIVAVARDCFAQRATFEELEAAVAALDKAEAS